MSVVSAAQKGIIHLESGIACGEIDGKGLIVPQDLTVAEFETIDGKSKKLLDGGPASTHARLSLRKISCAVWIERDVDHGLLEDEFVEPELGTQKRDDFQASYDAVHVSQRNLGGGLTAMYGDPAHVDL